LSSALDSFVAPAACFLIRDSTLAKFFISPSETQIWRLESKLEGVFNGIL
jgi:hypothetical protein